jgi:hypothetical protein
MLNYINAKEVMKNNDLNKTEYLKVSNYVLNEKTQNESQLIPKPQFIQTSLV